MKGQVVHVALLGVASVLALIVSTRDEKSDATPKPNDVLVWAGSPDAVSALSFEGKTRKVRLEPHKDDQGRWYVGTVDKDEAPPPPAHPPLAVDAGAPSASKHETVRFTGGKAADDLVKSLAPLHAMRAVGKVEGTRDEEFGLDKPEGTLKIMIGGKEQTLVIGGSTPTGSERYARTGSGEVFAIAGDIAQNLSFAESRLAEHDLHSFKPDEVTRVKISKAGKSREAVRIPEKNEGWADATAPGKLDETLGNWMSKVNRLRANDFVEKPSAPLAPDAALVHIDYFAGSKKLGYLELFRVPGEKGNDFLAKTEYQRWYVKVPNTVDQIDQDLASLLK
ncbi:MAG TPA: DUF4340 domain-containing protein [Polyangiaceae bacterium]|jgi:hypothetical protein